MQGRAKRWRWREGDIVFCFFFFFFFLSFLCDSANREICDERILEGPWRSLAGSLKAFLEKKSKKWERLLQVKKTRKQQTSILKIIASSLSFLHNDNWVDLFDSPTHGGHIRLAIFSNDSLFWNVKRGNVFDKNNNSGGKHSAQNSSFIKISWHESKACFTRSTMVPIPCHYFGQGPAETS